MNIYFLPFFVILCFGPWDTASNDTGEETTKKLERGPPTFEVLIRAASQAKIWAQRLRRFFKALRKWCNSHPLEVKLGKCFASYFNIKIPGPRRNEKIARSNEDPRETEAKIRKKFKVKGDVASRENQRRIFGNVFPENKFIFIVRNFFMDMRDRYGYYSDVLFRNDLLVCAWDYFWKKFWAWVDSLPDV